MRPGESRGGIRRGIARRFRLPLRTTEHADADAQEELRSFLDERIAALMSRGMSEEEARAEALRRLGLSFTDAAIVLRESARTRERRLTFRDFFDDLMQDVRYALRTLRRDRAFTLFAVLVVGLGVGASVAVFSIANRVLIRPLPFRDPGELAWIANKGEKGLSGETVQSQTLLDLREGAPSFRNIGGYVPFYDVDNTKFTAKDESARVTVIQVTENFFPMLGVVPMLGRSFTSDEASGTGPRAVLLSHLTWERRFESDAAIVGKAVVLNDEAVTVVGVLPPTFDFGSVFAPGARIDMFVPIPLNAEVNSHGNVFTMIGRLWPTATVAAALHEAEAVAKRINAEDSRREEFTPLVVTLKEHVSGRSRDALTILLVSVAVVMLIVCANLSNLLLARGSTREKEIALRVALGAGRGRLIRQMLTESTVLAVGGASLGLVLAIVGTRTIAGMSAFNMPMLERVSVDGMALAFTLVLTLVAGIAFGLAPALQIPSASVNGSLQSSGRGFAGDRRGQWTRNALVVAEVALACMLLVAAGLLTRSFYNVLDVDLGFQPHRVAAIRVDPGKEQLTSAARFTAYVDEVLERTRAMPGVEGAGLSDGLPLGGNRSWGAKAQGAPDTPESWPTVFVRIVSDGYIGSMGMRLERGRDFVAADIPTSEKVIIINESLAQRLWPGEDALGRIMIADTARRVVGIVHDVRLLAVDADGGLEMYLPFRQTRDFSAVNLVVRSTLPPETLTAALRIALQPLLPNLPTKQFQTLDTIVDDAVSPRRFTTLLSTGFALFAVALALLGIYGVVSYSVNQRTQEIGVRMALGASAAGLQLGIVRHTMMLAAIGIVIGSAGAWAIARGMQSILFGVTSTDPVTFAIVILLLTVVAVISGYVPARRVSRIDPLMALRSTT
ncbi:MAG: ABC transporter permease [Gemmatimonadota bacterium]